MGLESLTAPLIHIKGKNNNFNMVFSIYTILKKTFHLTKEKPMEGFQGKAIKFTKPQNGSYSHSL